MSKGYLHFKIYELQEKKNKRGLATISENYLHFIDPQEKKILDVRIQNHCKSDHYILIQTSHFDVSRQNRTY